MTTDNVCVDRLLRQATQPVQDGPHVTARAARGSKRQRRSRRGRVDTHWLLASESPAWSSRIAIPPQTAIRSQASATTKTRACRFHGDERTNGSYNSSYRIFHSQSQICDLRKRDVMTFAHPPTRLTQTLTKNFRIPKRICSIAPTAGDAHQKLVFAYRFSSVSFLVFGFTLC